MKTRGDWFEQRAADWLMSEGWTIVARNYQTRLGEIDIIALEQNTLVFIEVRARKNPQFASASGSVDWRKQRKVSRSAQLFLNQQPKWSNWACRFDVIAFEPTQSSAREMELRWIRSAFTT
ncbi:MAG: YraN family protein [Halioglobus sp.]